MATGYVRAPAIFVHFLFTLLNLTNKMHGLNGVKMHAAQGAGTMTMPTHNYSPCPRSVRVWLSVALGVAACLLPHSVCACLDFYELCGCDAATSRKKQGWLQEAKAVL